MTEIEKFLRVEIKRCREALEQITKDPPPTLDEPDTDCEVIQKYRTIARETLSSNEFAVAGLSATATAKLRGDGRTPATASTLSSQDRG